MLGTFPRTCGAHVCLLWENAVHFLVGLFVFAVELCGFFMYLGYEPSSETGLAVGFSDPEGRLPFCRRRPPPLFDVVPLARVCFWCQSHKTTNKTRVGELATYVFFLEFRGFRSHVQVFNQF